MVEDKKEQLLLVDPKNIRSKYTLKQTDTFYKVWHFIDIINCFYSAISYPYYTNNGLPDYPDGSFWLLWFSETLFFIDIVLNFFK